MVDLITLPSELLCLIVQHLGPGYLRACSERLLVCKTWYNICFDRAFAETELSVHQLEGFATAIRSQKPPHLAATVRRLTIRLVSYADFYDATDPSIHRTFHMMPAFAIESLKCFRIELNSDLQTIAECLPRLTNLQSFVLKSDPPHDTRNQTRVIGHDYLYDQTLLALLDALVHPTLTDVELDTQGSRFLPPEDVQSSPSPLHMCDHLRTRLHDYPNLRIRMLNLCPSILLATPPPSPSPSPLPSQPPNSPPSSSSCSSSRLETLTISLTIDPLPLYGLYVSQRHSYAQASPSCQATLTGWDLHGALTAAGKTFVGLAPGLRSLQILCHNEVPFRIVAEDCLTGRRTKYPEGQGKWGGPGGQDDVDDEEIQYSDSSEDDSVGFFNAC